MKILLTHPPADNGLKIHKGLRYPPLGLIFISAVAREHGYIVKIFDANIEKQPFHAFCKLLKEYRPDVIGISFTSLLSESAHAMAQFIKKNEPNIPVIAGGYHPTVLPLEVVKDNNFDFVIVGEGEYTFLEWLKKYESGKNDYDKIKGLVFRQNDKILQTGTREAISDLDNLPFPAYDLLSMHRYGSMVSTRKPYVTFIRSRGCPFNCIFCGVQKMFGSRYRCQSPGKTISDIDILIKKFKVKEILFKDSDFLIDKKNVEKFCTLLKAKQYDLIWSCNARVDMVDEGVLALMKQAGCKMITYGVESGDQDILNRLKKGITVSQIKNAVYLTKNAGIQCTINIIFGSPGETVESIQRTTNLVKVLDPDYVNFGYLTAFPGSELYEEALRNKWFIGETPASLSYEDLKLNATAISNQDLSRLLKSTVRSFYLNPKYISKKLQRMTFSEFKNNCKGLWAIIKNY